MAQPQEMVRAQPKPAQPEELVTAQLWAAQPEEMAKAPPVARPAPAEMAAVQPAEMATHAWPKRYATPAVSTQIVTMERSSILLLPGNINSTRDIVTGSRLG